MTFLDSAGETAKSDTAGRVRVARERRDQLLREFASSGISARRFAQLAGVNPVTFYSWVQKERARGQEGALGSNAGSVSFMEAVFDCPPTVSAGAEAPLVVHLCGGARAEIANKQGVPLLAQLLLELSVSGAGPLTHA
jgi:transposase-like protein